MDVQAFARLSKKLAKVPKRKKEEGPSANQPLVDEVLKKAGAYKTPEDKESTKEVPSADAGAGAGGSQVGELKRKNAGKGSKPPVTKKLRGTDEVKGAPLVILEEPSSSHLVDLDEGAWPQETVQFSFKKGTAIVHGTLDPKE
ncbi:unnamed protein product, partial [Cuscuta epithymum]